MEADRGLAHANTHAKPNTDSYDNANAHANTDADHHTHTNPNILTDTGAYADRHARRHRDALAGAVTTPIQDNRL